MCLKLKLAIAEEMQALGVDVIEADFPAELAEDAKFIEAIAQNCWDVCVCAFVLSKREVVKSPAEVVKGESAPRINLVLPVSDLHSQNFLRRDRESTLELLKRCKVHARNFCSGVKFIAADVSCAGPAFLCMAVEANIQFRSYFITLTDTVGYATSYDTKVISTLCTMLCLQYTR